MKVKVSLMLAMLMAFTSFAQMEPIPVPPTNEQNHSLCEAMLLIGATAAGIYFVIWAMNGSKKNCCVGPADLILMQDAYNGQWLPVATNHIPATCSTNKFDVFRGTMGGAGYRYRVLVVPTAQ